MNVLQSTKTKQQFWREATIALGLFILLISVLAVSQYSLIIPVLIFIMGLHLSFFGKANLRLLANLGLLLAILMLTMDVFRVYPQITPLYIPVASLAMLTMLLFHDLQLVFMMSFIASMISALMAGGGIGMMVTYFLSSLVGAYTVKGARTRGRLIAAGLYVGLTQVLCALVMNPSVSQTSFDLVFRPLFLNGIICFFVVVSTLKIFETIFGEITHFTLLELADSSNQPLLKKMIMEAPGTYHHSLIVSNLAEAAADAIGAHGLLARVGSYYHDIGKMIKPEYFTENQMVSGNKHDDLEPSMSRLVILNHVKEGIELAKKNRLNQKIVDFIPQHHGTALIFYFYQKALAESGGDKIEEENYRYPGPKPQTRETAIVMLADSAEGATRSLEDHTPARVEDVVHKVINNKFIDGQLDECDLTLRDIEVIASVFTHILTAMYHGRVKYPEKKANEPHQHRKSADENPRHPGQD